MFTLDQLRMLDALERHGTITEAAHSLSLTQPAASRLLARMGLSVGIALVRRRGRGVELTEAGRLLAAHARMVVDRLGAAEADMRRLREREAPRVRVGALSSPLIALVPRALALLSPRERAQVLVAHAPDAGAAVAAVASGDLDVAVVWDDEGGAEPPEGLRARRLLVEEWVVVLPAGHPAAGPAVVPLAALREAPWIVGAESARRRTLEGAAARAGFAPLIASVQTDQLVMQGLVAAGVGVALLPAASVQVLHPALVVRALAPAPAPRVVLAVHNHPSAVAGPRDALLAALERAGEGMARR
jgi:DNA-binding transcriptional LysR family regulator